MSESTLPKPTNTGKLWWSRISTKAKAENLEPYFVAKQSNAVIAAAFDISPGSVARVRDNRNKRLYPSRYVNGRGKVIKTVSLPTVKDEKPATKDVKKVKPPKEPKTVGKKPKVNVRPKETVVEVFPPDDAVPPSPHLGFRDISNRAEHAPGKSPLTQKLMPDASRYGAKDSPFPKTQKQTGNPDDLTEKEMRDYENMFFPKG